MMTVGILIDPHTKKVVRTVSARELWQKIIRDKSCYW